MEKTEICDKVADFGLVSDESESKTKVKKSRTEPENEAAAMRVSLPASLTTKVRAAMTELKSRGATVSADDLLAEFWSKIAESYFEEAVTKFTPEEYYLEAARKIPEIREKLIQQAKKALDLSTNGRSMVRKPRRQKTPAAAVIGAVSA